MVNYNDLPQFLKDRISTMSEEVRNAFLHTIDQDWVEGQICAHELTQGVKNGKWTWEDIKNEFFKNKS